MTAAENRQNLIVEGCYIPFDWRKDFDGRYLADIRFVCLAMTEAYIDACFETIKQHASDIEARLDDSCCTAGVLKAENRMYREGFEKRNEYVVLIDTDYEDVIQSVLDELEV